MTVSLEDPRTCGGSNAQPSWCERGRTLVEKEKSVFSKNSVFPQNTAKFTTTPYDEKERCCGVSSALMPIGELNELIKEKFSDGRDLFGSIPDFRDTRSVFQRDNSWKGHNLGRSRSVPIMSASSPLKIREQKVRERRHWMDPHVFSYDMGCHHRRVDHEIHRSTLASNKGIDLMTREKVVDPLVSVRFMSPSVPPFFPDSMMTFLGQNKKCLSAFCLWESDLVLRALLDEIMPSYQERHIKRCIVRFLASLIKMWKGNMIKTCVAGSTAYDVDCTASDLDIVLVTGEKEYSALLEELSCTILKYQQEYSRGYLHRRSPDSLPYCSSQSAWSLKSVKLQLVHNARVPILLLKCPRGVVCDISVNTINSISHTNFFKAILSKKPHLRALMRLVKFWVRMRRVPVTRDGGLPNIVWMLLCVLTSRHTEICYSPSALALVSETGVNHPSPPLSFLSKDQRVCYEKPNTPKNKLLEHFASPFTRWMWSLNLSFLKTNSLSLYTVLLSEFFSRLGSRDALRCTVSIAAGICIPKNPHAVAQRVLSPLLFCGVWDDLISVEDPAYFDEGFFPTALLSPPSTMLFSDLTGPNISPNGIPTPQFRDLVTRVSSATWLVYQYELKRANDIITTLIMEFQSFLFHFENQLPHMLHPFLVRQLHRFVNLFSQLFTENLEERYRIPAVMTEQPQVLPSEKVSDKEKSSPPLSGGLALVLLDGKLMLLQLSKVCGDRSGWWSTEFLTRRDVRSVLHGKPYFALALMMDSQDVFPTENVLDAEGVFTTSSCNGASESCAQDHWFLCNASLYRKILQLEGKTHHMASLEEGKVSGSTLFPSHVMSDTEILFNPCNLVCFLRMIPIKPKDFCGATCEDSLCVLPVEEVKKLQLFVLFAKEAPYWYTKANETHLRLGLDTSKTLASNRIQPAIRLCRHCKGTGQVDFDDSLGLPHDPYIFKHGCVDLQNKFPDTSAFRFLKKNFFQNSFPKFSDLHVKEPHNSKLEKKIIKSMSSVTGTLNHVLYDSLCRMCGFPETQEKKNAQPSRRFSDPPISRKLTNPGETPTTFLQQPDKPPTVQPLFTYAPNSNSQHDPLPPHGPTPPGAYRHPMASNVQHVHRSHQAKNTTFPCCTGSSCRSCNRPCDDVTQVFQNPQCYDETLPKEEPGNEEYVSSSIQPFFSLEPHKDMMDLSLHTVHRSTVQREEHKPSLQSLPDGQRAIPSPFTPTNREGCGDSCFVQDRVLGAKKGLSVCTKRSSCRDVLSPSRRSHAPSPMLPPAMLQNFSHQGPWTTRSFHGSPQRGASGLTCSCVKKYTTATGSNKVLNEPHHDGKETPVKTRHKCCQFLCSSVVPFLDKFLPSQPCFILNFVPRAIDPFYVNPSALDHGQYSVPTLSFYQPITPMYMVVPTKMQYSSSSSSLTSSVLNSSGRKPSDGLTFSPIFPLSPSKWIFTTSHDAGAFQHTPEPLVEIPHTGQPQQGWPKKTPPHRHKLFLKNVPLPPPVLPRDPPQPVDSTPSDFPSIQSVRQPTCSADPPENQPQSLPDHLLDNHSRTSSSSCPQNNKPP